MTSTTSLEAQIQNQLRINLQSSETNTEASGRQKTKSFQKIVRFMKKI